MNSSGEQSALSTPQGQRDFYNKHIDQVFAISLRMLRNRETAKDAVQKTFIKVFSNLDKFRDESDVNTWIYRICTNACLDLIAKEKKEKVAFNDEINYSDISEHKTHKKGPIEEQVRRVLKTIDVDYAKTFWLFTMEQLNQEHIATIMNISVPTVKFRLSKVKKILHKALSKNKL